MLLGLAQRIREEIELGTGRSDEYTLEISTSFIMTN
jgi:hypothetical protein